MTYEEFEEAAHRMWEQVPTQYREGIDGIVVRREAETHPDHDEYFTMGMCFTEPYPSGFGGPDSTHSILALYHGSFSKISEFDPDFSWEEELWETVTHELRHHLEFLVEDDALGREDYALEQTHRRQESLDFDPWYFQSGTAIAPGVYRVERDVYIEQPWRPNRVRAGEAVEFEWAERRRAILLPRGVGDVHYLWLPELVTEGCEVQLVLIRELPLWQRIRRLLMRAPLELTESEGDAYVVEGGPSTSGEPPGAGGDSG